VTGFSTSAPSLRCGPRRQLGGSGQSRAVLPVRPAGHGARHQPGPETVTGRRYNSTKRRGPSLGRQANASAARPRHVADSPGGPMPTPPSQPPGAGRSGPPPKPGARQPAPPPEPRTRQPAPPEPGARQPAPPPESSARQPRHSGEPGVRQPRSTPRPEKRKSTRQGCQREVGRPLPDPAAVRLCAVPDSAPPYDDEALAGTLAAGPAHTASADGGVGTSPADAGQRSDDGRGRRPPIPDPDRPDPDRLDSGDASGAGPDRGAAPGWPSLFAQVLVETLAGARPAGQIVPWTTQRARSNIQRLGPTLTAGQPTARQRPLVRRVVTSRPCSDVLEMTVIVGFGPRIRALAVRLELSQPRGIPAGRAARWLCTAVEAA